MVMNYDAPLALLMFICFGLLFYTYAGYPLLLWAAGRWAQPKDRPEAAPQEWPKVSVLVSAFNEENAIGERIRNLLSLDYPKDRIEIIVGSDGSTDRTCEIVRSYEASGVRLLCFDERRGKASVVNDLVAQARNEIAILTDANTFFRQDVVRELVRAMWRYPSNSVVVGRLDLRAPAENENLDGAYWRYETWIKMLESRFGSLLGANGAIYAFRRERFRPLPREAIVDDFLVPMLMRQESGDRVYFVPEARAWEKSPEEVKDEFRRHTRIGAGNFQALKWTWKLLLPWKGTIALAYFSHKVLRWLGPWLMLIGFLTNLRLLYIPFFALLFLGQIALYELAFGALLLHREPVVGRIASAMRYLLILNVALLIWLGRCVLGIERPFWSTAPRRV
jgi:cellulose synthase/poly-beta-1,6-N-acetylglucosamine synthase-like glycosyltransferase